MAIMTFQNLWSRNQDHWQAPLIALAGLLTAIAPQQAEAHWCNNGSKLNRIEQAICSDSVLINKDQELNSLYRTLGGRKNGPLKAGQRVWIRNRNSCNTLGCLHAYYDDRLNVLRSMTYGNRTPIAPAPPPQTTFTPPPPPQMPDTSTSATRIPGLLGSQSSGGTSSEPLEKLPDIKPF